MLSTTPDQSTDIPSAARVSPTNLLASPPPLPQPLLYPAARETAKPFRAAALLPQCIRSGRGTVPTEGGGEGRPQGLWALRGGCPAPSRECGPRNDAHAAVLRTSCEAPAGEAPAGEAPAGGTRVRAHRGGGQSRQRELR
jgi:hypothetical protein